MKIYEFSETFLKIKFDGTSKKFSKTKLKFAKNGQKHEFSHILVSDLKKGFLQNQFSSPGSSFEFLHKIGCC